MATGRFILSTVETSAVSKLNGSAMLLFFCILYPKKYQFLLINLSLVLGDSCLKTDCSPVKSKLSELGCTKCCLGRKLTRFWDTVNEWPLWRYTHKIADCRFDQVMHLYIFVFYIIERLFLFESYCVGSEGLSVPRYWSLLTRHWSVDLTLEYCRLHIIRI